MNQSAYEFSHSVVIIVAVHTQVLKISWRIQRLSLTLRHKVGACDRGSRSKQVMNQSDNVFILFSDYPSESSLLVGWISCLGLTVHDKRILTTKACLNANHISAAMKLLKLQFPQQNGLNDTAYLTLKSVWPSQPYDFIQIIYINPNHWACLSNIYCEDENTVDLYDSSLLAPSNGGSIVPQISTILGTRNFRINLINVSLQMGGTDCGLYAVATATSLANREDPSFIHYIQSAMRSHLEYCFQREYLITFAGLPRVTKKRILSTFEVEDNKIIKSTYMHIAHIVVLINTHAHTHRHRSSGEKLWG